MRFDRSMMLAAGGGALGSLDTALNVAFPDLVDGLGITIADLQWVVVSYVLSYGGLLLAAGQWGDTFGHRRMLIIGATGSAAAMILCALAPDFRLFLAARVVQGVSAAMVMAAAPAMASVAAGGGAKGRGLSVFQTATGAGAAIGPLIGGPLVLLWGWPAVFWFRVPICIGLIWLARSVAATGQVRKQKADVYGAVLVTIALTAGLLTLNSMRSFGLASPVLWVATVVTAAVGLAYGLRSRSHPSPIVDLALFTSRRFSVANLLNVMANGSMFVAWLLVPALLVTELDRPAIVAGLVLAASPIAMGLASSVAGRWSDRSGYRTPVLVGLVAEAAGLAWLATASDQSSVLSLTLAMAVIGTGLGLFAVPNMAMVMSTMPDTEQGTAGGLSLLMRTAGIVIGVSGSAALFEFLEPGRTFFEAFRLTTATSAIVAATAAAIAMADGLARNPVRRAVA